MNVAPVLFGDEFRNSNTNSERHLLSQTTQSEPIHFCLPRPTGTRVSSYTLQIFLLVFPGRYFKTGDVSKFFTFHSLQELSVMEALRIAAERNSHDAERNADTLRVFQSELSFVHEQRSPDLQSVEGCSQERLPRHF